MKYSFLRRPIFFRYECDLAAPLWCFEPHWRSGCILGVLTVRAFSQYRMALHDAPPSDRTDLVAQPAGVRLGEQIARDMIAVRIGPDMRMVVVGAPSYFARRPKPKKPQHLTAHRCINLRLPTFGGLYAWEFEKRGHELKVRVEGQLVFNNLALRLKSALAGLGLAYLPEDQVRTHVADGRLVQVLDDRCPAFSGYHLYYPNRRHLTPAFGLLVDALRYRS
jgi:DNA-binding transcriptional LysR family regulator